jgi:hypothetical protein
MVLGMMLQPAGHGSCNDPVVQMGVASTVVTDVPGSAIQHDPANEIYGDKFNPSNSIVLGQVLVLYLLSTTPKTCS